MSRKLNSIELSGQTKTQANSQLFEDPTQG